MAIKTLIVLLLLMLLNGCTVINIQAGGKFDKSLYPETIYANIVNWSDRIVLKDGTEVIFKRAVGRCGAEGGVLIIIIIPIPMFIPNSCEEKFRIKVPYKTNNPQIKLKYNNKTHEPIDIVDAGDDIIIGFKVNMKELLGSEYKAIIVEKEGFIQELPFEWGVMIKSMGIGGG